MQQLPKVLSEQELEKCSGLLPTRNRMPFYLAAYSLGLRVSEMVHFKLSDIDSNHMQILIENVKDKKTVL